MKTIFILSIIILIQFNGFTQIQKDNQFNTWVTYSGNHKLNDKYSIYTLYSFRRNDFVENWQQSLLRLGINRKIKDHFTVTFGYDWAETFPYGKQPIIKQTTEHRPFEQISLKNKIGRFKLIHRYRLEQRFIETNFDFKFRNRCRYRFTVTVPLNHTEMTNKTIYLSVFNELFINAGKNIESHYFDQNWAYLGVGFKFNKQTKVSIGYMNQFLPKSDNLRIENNHTLGLSFSHNFNFLAKYEK